jgi:hypothetical protein
VIASLPSSRQGRPKLSSVQNSVCGRSRDTAAKDFLQFG